MKFCPICEGGLDKSTTADYLKCTNCGHEVLQSGQAQTIMVNDDLNFEKIVRSNVNIRAQIACLKKVSVGNDLLIDVGCGSGGFLHHCKALFDNLLGIEISEKSAQFATLKLGLPIADRLPKSVNESVSAVTFWHSLEHIPASEFPPLFSDLHKISGDDTRIIISVPNAESLQFKMLKQDFAYYDVPNHLHQFTSASLNLLMRKNGFQFHSHYKMPVYDLFGYIQGLINRCVSPANLLYYTLKRGMKHDRQVSFARLKVGVSFLLAGILLPIAFLLLFYDHFNPTKASVITYCYCKV